MDHPPLAPRSNDKSPEYRAAHRAVVSARGKASQYLCPCGAQALDWSYQGSDKGSGMSPFSTDVTLYEPRCRKCHIREDKPYLLTRPGQTIFQRRQEDPEYDAQWRESQRAAALLGGLAMKDRLTTEWHRQGVAVTNARRVTCSCGMESTPGPIARHKKVTGHA